MYIKPLKIGNVELENNVILAPMAGITDLPFRIVCKDFGVGLVTTEMVSSKAIYYNDEKTKLLLNMENEKRPVSAQIFGSDVITMVAATKYVGEIADILDINMGCPAPKVVKNGDGSKLLTNLKLVEEILNAVVEASKIPVTLKIRSGWNNENIVAIDVAKIAENAGISAITIHGRTREEFFKGNVDLKIIEKVKNNVKIPVIGNGDIVDRKSAIRMFETGVDGIMLGRGTIGNPWLIKEILNPEFDSNEVSLKEKLEVILKHINLAVEDKGESIAIKEMRKHLAYYIRNLKDATVMRNKINQITTKQELETVLIEYFK